MSDKPMTRAAAVDAVIKAMCGCGFAGAGVGYVVGVIARYWVVENWGYPGKSMYVQVHLACLLSFAAIGATIGLLLGLRRVRRQRTLEDSRTPR